MDFLSTWISIWVHKKFHVDEILKWRLYPYGYPYINIFKKNAYEDVPQKRPPVVATEPSYYGGENEHTYAIAFFEFFEISDKSNRFTCKYNFSQFF